MSNLAVTRRGLGDPEGARRLHEQALVGYRRVLGDDHPDLHNNLAETHRSLGDLQGARKLFEQALAGRQQALGHDHPDTLTSMNDLAEVHRLLGAL
jgi:tetratricopeptide (TPR) repeat protein